MGVPGLWPLISKAEQQRALTHLAIIEGFERNKSTRRAYRVGIDISIWYHHAQYSKAGENPILRLIFFRLRQLAELPILPLFVFDGRERPKLKRGSRLGKSGSHYLNDPMKEMLDAFGMEWRMARGEAEAELAYLNQKGYIDAILTDDCDALVFGGHTIIKNFGSKLSGNKSSAASQTASTSNNKKPYVNIYSIDEIHDKTQFTRGGLVLFALLAGGDYHKGLDKIGAANSYALARCGFGDRLLKAYQENAPTIRTFLPEWRVEVNTELRTNSQGRLPRRTTAVIPEDFPDLQILDFYVNPVNSGRVGTNGGGAMRDKGNLNLGKLAAFCEKYFEWGDKINIVKRFRDLMWPAAVMHVIRRAALEADDRERTKRIDSGIRDGTIRGSLKPSRTEAVGTPASLVNASLNAAVVPAQNRYAAAFSNKGKQAPTPQPIEHILDTHPLIIRILRTRQHKSTGEILEYGVEICPVQLVALTRAGIKGTRSVPPNGAFESDEMPPASQATGRAPKKPPPPPDSMLRIWIPASMLHQVHPGLVEDFAMTEEARINVSQGKGKRKAKAVEEEETDDEEDDGDEDDDDEDDLVSSAIPTILPPQGPPRPVQSRANTQPRGKGKKKANAVEKVADDRTHNIQQVQEPLRPVEPPLIQANAIVDPWFMSGEGESMQFLFTFPDPDDPGDVEPMSDSAPFAPERNDMVLRDPAPAIDEDYNIPQGPFDQLWDQVLDGPSRKKTAKKPRAPQGVKRPRQSAPAASRMHASDDFLTPYAHPERNDMIMGDSAPAMDEDDDGPQNPLDQLWDQILDGTGRKKAAKKPRAPKSVKRPQTASTAPRIRPSDNILTKLDKIEARQEAKRRRVFSAGEPGLPPIQLFPDLPGLGNPRPASASSSRSWDKRPANYIPQRYTSYQYPEPSSSQASRLSEDFIDLT